MKTRAIITAIIAAASISSLQSKAAKPSASAAQELLTDGKVWNCVQRMYNDQTGEYDRPFTITVVGYTIVGEVKCKRLEQFWNDDTATLTHFAALESDARVYLVTEEPLAYIPPMQHLKAIPVCYLTCWAGQSVVKPTRR